LTVRWKENFSINRPLSPHFRETFKGGKIKGRIVFSKKKDSLALKSNFVSPKERPSRSRFSLQKETEKDLQ